MAGSGDGKVFRRSAGSGSGKRPRRGRGGYGDPPISGQIRKGERRNPKGRPRGSKNRPKDLAIERLEALLQEEAYRPVTASDGAQSVTIPLAQAVLRSLGVKAAKGDHRSQRLFLETVSVSEARRARARDEDERFLIRYKYETEFQMGLASTDPLPHPDHIIIEPDGRVWINGPFDRESKAKWDRLAKKRRALQLECEFYRRIMSRQIKPSFKMALEGYIAINEDLIAMLSEGLGNYAGPELTQEEKDAEEEFLRQVDDEFPQKDPESDG